MTRNFEKTVSFIECHVRSVGTTYFDVLEIFLVTSGQVYTHYDLTRGPI